MAPRRVAVLGGGSWGTTVAHLCAHNAATTLWARDPATAATVAADRVNRRYLDGFTLHPALEATADVSAAVAGADVVVFAVPSGAMRVTAASVAALVGPDAVLVSAAKGFEATSFLRMSDVLAAELPGRPVAVLTGPNLAKEVLAGLPAAAVVAAADPRVAAELQPLFTTAAFRVFTHHDVVGCEVGGALKNVYAIAAGSVEGMGLGDNARAAIITRSLAELIEIGTRLGGEALTLAGLAGLGDLMATCISPQSRNVHVGRELGRGRTLQDILAGMDQVAEGVQTVRVVRSLARRLRVSLPIAGQVHAVCFEGRSPSWAHDSLLRGRVGHETPGQRIDAPRRSRADTMPTSAPG
jgi:glycerol-3-phosphate dehydrogenase (NAD(P)+)